MSTAWPKDVFGRPAQIGDYIAAGMSYGQSSVLRVGQIINIKESVDSYSKTTTGRFSVRVRWRNNGRSTSRFDVKDSNILYDERYSYSKFLILDKAMVEQFPPDITDED